MEFGPEVVVLVLALLAIGGFAGFLAGLLGVGGGIVLVPAFFYVFGALGYGGAQLMQLCVATSLATIVVTSLRSVQAHHARGAVDWAVLRSWAPFVVLGAAAGVVVAGQVSSRVLQGVFGALGTVAGLYLAMGRTPWQLADRLPGQPARGLWAGGLGFFSAMMGIGGGTFGVLIQSLYAVPIHRAVATSAGLGVLIAAPGTALFLALPVQNPPPLTWGAVNLPAFLVVIAATLVTAPLGAQVAHRMNAGPLKRIFALFIIAVALNMLRKMIWV